MGEIPPNVPLPTAAVKVTIDKICDFLREKNDQSLLDIIREKQKGNAMYNFLNETDENYPYFSWKLGRGRSHSEEFAPAAINEIEYIPSIPYNKAKKVFSASGQNCWFSSRAPDFFDILDNLVGNCSQNNIAV